MSDASDFSHFSRQAARRDGTPVLIRASRPDDVDKVVVALHKLDPQSVYTRCFSHRKELKAEVLASNSPMLSVFHHSGLPMTESGDDGLVHVVLDLVNKPPPGPAP